MVQRSGCVGVPELPFDAGELVGDVRDAAGETGRVESVDRLDVEPLRLSKPTGARRDLCETVQDIRLASQVPRLGVELAAALEAPCCLLEVERIEAAVVASDHLVGVRLQHSHTVSSTAPISELSASTASATSCTAEHRLTRGTLVRSAACAQSRTRRIPSSDA